jgi:hypothetical protein
MKTANDNNTQIRELEVGETRECGALRFHRYREGLTVTDLTNAGKRGKVVSEIYVGQRSRGAGDAASRLQDVCDLVCSVTQFATLAALVDCYVDEHPHAISVDEFAHKSIDVRPAGFEAITICNVGMRLTADYDGFGVSDLTDRDNEPRLIPTCHSGKKTAVKRFYAYVSANRERLTTASFSQVWDGMQTAGVRAHYYCAMD